MLPLITRLYSHTLAVHRLPWRLCRSVFWAPEISVWIQSTWNDWISSDSVPLCKTSLYNSRQKLFLKLQDSLNHLATPLSECRGYCGRRSLGRGGKQLKASAAAIGGHWFHVQRRVPPNPNNVSDTTLYNKITFHYRMPWVERLWNQVKMRLWVNVSTEFTGL